jgi:hypothetical protein
MSECKSPITLTTSADVSSKRLVKLSSGTVLHNTSTSTDSPIGVSDYAGASGDNIAIRLLSEPGTIEMTSSGAISQDASVYAADAGKIQALPTTGGAYKRIGTAMEASTLDGDIIEILPSLSDDIEYVAETILSSGSVSVVNGVATQIDSSGGSIAATLADGSVIGQKKFIVMTDASNSSTVSIAHHATSDPEVATFDAVDEFLELVWTGTEWETVKATATFV